MGWELSMRSLISTIAIIAICILVVPELVAADDAWTPWDYRVSADCYGKEVRCDAVSPGKLTFNAFVYTYKTVISPVDGKHCPMYPSCSSYCKHSIDEYGVLIGIMMAADRLHRCGHDLKYYSNVYYEDRVLKYDPANR
jgi:putative component of membrane protein insertase Oxa1/YidC/SpoIIIJ protein YidD